MPRINIEDRLFSDPRFHALAKKHTEETAIGVCYRAWRLAQDYIKTGNGIPVRQFMLLRGATDLIEYDLARVEGDFVRVAGEEEHLRWLVERAKAGRSGGRAKSRNHSEIRLANASKHKQTLASSSSSYSYSNTNTIPSEVAVPATVPVVLSKTDDGQSVRSVIATYCEAWKRRYGSNPPIAKRDAGLVRNMLRGGLGEQRLKDLAQAYVQLDDPWFEKKAHDLATLSGNLAKVSAEFERLKNTNRFEGYL